MAYAVGHISGGHFNPAVSFGLMGRKRFAGKELLPYIIAQVLGAIFAGLVLYLIASGKEGFSPSNGFGANGYGDILLGAILLYIVSISPRDCFNSYVSYGHHGSNRQKGSGCFAPLAIGLALGIDPPDQYSS